MAELKNTAINGDLNVSGIININNKNIFNLIYPKGSYYWTENKDFNPNTSFGGTWVKVEDKMLMAKGTKFTTNGGSDLRSFSLLEKNLPKHKHSINHTHTYTPAGKVGEHTHKFEHYHNKGSMNITGNVYILSHYNSNATGCFTSTREGYRHEGWTSGEGIKLHFNANNSGSWTGVTSKPRDANDTKDNLNTDPATPTFTGTQANLSITASSGETGSGTAMNLMPPYEVAYCWKRTA